MTYFTAFTPFKFWMKSQEMKKWKNGSMFADPVRGRKFQTSLYWVQAIPFILNRLLFVGESWVRAQKKIWKGSKLNDNFCQLQATREERKVLYQQLLESKIQRAKLSSATPCTLWYLGNVRASCLHDLAPYRNSVSSCTQGSTEPQPTILQWMETFDHVQERGWRLLKGLGFIKLWLLLSASQS